MLHILACPYCGQTEGHGVHAKNGVNIRYRCKKGCGRTFNTATAIKAVPIEEFDSGDFSSRYVITSAISGCPVNKDFFASLETYCTAMNAELIVVPIRYRNPTSTFEKPEDWFDAAIDPYMFDGRRDLCPNLQLLADIPTQPTAVRPLSGLQNLSGSKCSLFGHPKIALESVATRLGEPAKLIATTGAVTNPIYSESKAGKKGEFHHVLGAVIVDVEEGGIFHMRHVKAADDGSFQDLDLEWTPNGPFSKTVTAITMGDLHACRADDEVLEGTIFAEDSLVSVLRPKYLILHDVLDFQSASHHNTFFDNFKLSTRGQNDVYKELLETFELLDEICEASDAKLVIVPSNHHDHFEKWLSRAENAHDVKNAWVYHKTKTAYLEAIMRNEYFDPLRFWASQVMRNYRQVQFLEIGESFEIDGVEYGHHGHKGPNGSRGGIAGFTRVGAKMTVGHSHTPGIMDGVYQVGTSSQMDMGYNKDALSSWMATHCVHYGNGARALINIVNGRW